MDRPYRVTYHEDAQGNTILRYSGDAQGLVDACAKEARDRRESFAKPTDMRKILSVDPVTLMDVAHKHGIDYSDYDALFEILKGRDYSKLRTVDDRLLWKSRRR